MSNPEFAVSTEIRDGRTIVLPIQPFRIPVTEPLVTQEGFVRSGVNSTDLIRGLRSIEGIPIETLEHRMKPFRVESHQRRSISHVYDTTEIARYNLLNEGQRLTDVLATDNDIISGISIVDPSGERPLTHQDMTLALSYPVFAYFKYKDRLGTEPSTDVAYTMPNGTLVTEKTERYFPIRPLSLDSVSLATRTVNPFDDKQEIPGDIARIIITNVTTGESISYLDAYQRSWIYRYGFYGSGNMRVDPIVAARVLGFSK